MGTVVGQWRLKAIIMLCVLLPSIYIVNGFFFNVDVDDNGYYEKDGSISIVDADTGYETEKTIIDYNASKKGTDEGTDFVDLIFNAGSYLTFGNIQNVYARIIINLFVTICWIVIGYIVYSFIKEWIPLT